MEIEELHDPEFLEAIHHVDALQAPSIDGKHLVHDSDLLTDRDPNIIEFEADDPENSLNWPQWRKWTVLVLVSMMNTLGYVSLPEPLLAPSRFAPMSATRQSLQE